MSGMARDAVLARIRRALDADREVPESPRRDVESGFACASGAERCEAFREGVERAAGTVESVEAWAEVPGAVDAYARTRAIHGPWAIAPALADLEWPHSRTTWIGGSRGAEALGVACARFGIAETGTLVLCSDRASPVSLNFLPEHHVVALAASDLVDVQEAVWSELRALRGLPRTINFITGPSRTADVEQTLQLGAHGPRSVHVLLVTGEKGRRILE